MSLLKNILIVAAFIAIYMLIAYSISRILPEKNCQDFATYQQAVDSYNQGNVKLDGNHNQVPCEALLKHG